MNTNLRDLEFFRNDHPTLHYRKGAVIIIPLVCLVLSLAIVGELLKQTSIEINQLKKTQYHVQACWLAEAAAQRTVKRLKEDSTYSGEIWQLSPQDIGSNYPGQVVIEIKRNSKQDQNTILIRTEASYPVKISERVRVVREWPAEL